MTWPNKEERLYLPPTTSPLYKQASALITLLKNKNTKICIKTAIASPTPPRGVLQGPSLHMTSQPHNGRLHRHAEAPLPPPPSQPQALLAHDSQAVVPLQGLRKQHSWSPDIYRDEAWLRRKGRFNKNKRSKSVTDEDLDELKACIELGFGFDSPEPDADADADHRRLSDTLPALELYYAVNKNYIDSVSKSTVSDCESPSPLGSPHTFFSPGENDPQTVKTRLRQWAQVVACSVRQFSSS